MSSFQAIIYNALPSM